jgi:hypothetical protein
VFKDGGDDGLNMNGGGVKTLSIGSSFQNNVGDGFAPHGTTNSAA